jgi:hypothetical protein
MSMLEFQFWSAAAALVQSGVRMVTVWCTAYSVYTITSMRCSTLGTLCTCTVHVTCWCTVYMYSSNFILIIYQANQGVSGKYLSSKLFIK